MTTVDFESLKPDISKGITVKQNKEFSQLRQRLQKKNTLNKRLQETTLTTLKGKNILLEEALGGKRALLLIGSNTCAFSKICFFENFPKLIVSLNKLNINPKLIKLVVHESDYINFNQLDPKFEEYLNNSQALYPKNTFIISRNETKKFNYFSNVSTFFIDENQLVRKIKRGASVDLPYTKLEDVKAFFSKY